MTGIMLCVTSGRGPAECRQAVGHVLKRIEDEAAALDLAFGSEPFEDGQPSVLLTLHGEGAEAFVRRWQGSILWVSPSRLRANVRRKNWFVKVERLMVPPPGAVLLERDIRFETLRAGGPGGQHQNKTQSAVRATHLPSGLAVVVRDQRSQFRNKALAIERLQSLADALAHRAQNAKVFADWLSRIVLERGNPVRVFEGPAFSERRE